MNRYASASRIVLAFSALALLGPASLAGPLAPPAGPVAPTGRTLTEVRPSTPIQSLPGSSNAEFVISASGAYHLVGNIGPQGPGRFAIDVNASRVTIDLNGFAIAGNNSETFPAIDFSSTACRVHNGTIQSWGGSGVRATSNVVVEDIIFDFVGNEDDDPTVDLGRGSALRDCTFRACSPLQMDGNNLIRGCLFRDMGEAIASPTSTHVHIIDCAFDGQGSVSSGAVIALGDDAYLSRVTVSREGRTAADLGQYARVEDCVFTGVTSVGAPLANGMEVQLGSIVTGTSVSSYKASGIVAQGVGVVIQGCSVVGCEDTGIVGNFATQISDNAVHGCRVGINLSFGSRATNNTVRGCTDAGIELESDGEARGNTLDNNSIVVNGSENVIDGNTITDISPPIDLLGINNLVIRNRYSLGLIAGVAGNTVAAPVTAGTIDTAGPYANISF